MTTAIQLGSYVHSYIDSYGYNPLNLYCLVTGKPVGGIFEEELLEVIDSCTDVSDLRLRLLASMRPSMKWNRLRVESLDSLRKSHPVETMAYLLNRLFAPPRESTKSIPFETLHENRILLFARLAEFRLLMTDIPHSSWDSVMHQLLELEAKLGLPSEVAPFGPSDLLAVPTDSLMTTLLALLTPFHKRRVEWHRQREADAQFFATNPGARRAYAKSWMEQQPDKPASETQQKRAEKQKDANFFAAIFDELVGDGAHKPSNQRPDPEIMAKPAKVAIPQTKMPKRFGGLKGA